MSSSRCDLGRLGASGPFRLHPPPIIWHGVTMGSADDKPRKRRHPLKKVPKYQEPNSLPIPGVGSSSSFGLRYGRFGHGSGNEHHRRRGLGDCFCGC